ncbi:MAG: hypothetical protein KA797_09685, partial [Chitinophagales bacterium]|nr:hypothetical protein [Chitinophagales bacterium]
MDQIIGFLSPIIVYAIIFILGLILPGRWVVGYVTKENSDEKLKYRLNGLLVMFMTVVTWIILCNYQILDWDYFYQYRWYALSGAISFGLLFSFV